MFKKLGRAFGGSSGAKNSVRVKFELQVVQAERLPQSVKKCRIVWSRSAKVQMTAVKDARNGTAVFKQTLVQIGNVHKDKRGEYEAKEYIIKVQVPDSSSGDNNVTIGKATIDLAQYVMDTTNQQTEMLPITYKVGSSTNGFIKLVIITTVLGEAADDAMTEVSGLTGLTSQDGDQDLDGFDNDNSPGNGRKGSKTAARTGARGKAALPTTQEDSDEEGEGDRPGKARPKANSGSAGPSSRPAPSGDPFAKKTSEKPPPRPKWQDDDISPVDSELSDGEDARPPPKKADAASKVDLNDRRRVVEPEPDLSDMKSALFSKKKPDATSSTSSTSKAPPAAANSKPSNNSQTEDEARDALFAVPSKAGRGGPKSAAAVPAAPKAVPAGAANPFAAADEDAARSALFATAKKPAAAAAAGAAAGKAGTSSGKAKGASQPQKQYDDESEGDEEELYGPPAAKGRPGLAKPNKAQDFDDFGEEPAFPVKTTSAPDDSKSSRKASASRAAAPAPVPTRQAAGPGYDYDSEEDREALGVATGSRAAPASSKAAGSNSEELRKANLEIERLQAQVQQLQHQLQQTNDHILELDGKLAEADPAAFYAQMQEMEAQHAAQIKQMDAAKLAEIDKLKQRYEEHLAEMEEELHAAQSSGAGGASQAQREAELAELEAQARAKLAEANRMADETMVVAVKHQQERKALQAEIDGLRVAVARSQAAKAPVYNTHDEDDENDDNMLVQDLKEQIAELQKKNDMLQKASTAAQQEAAVLREDVTGMMREAGLNMPNTQEAGPLAGCAAAFSSLHVELTEVQQELRDARAAASSKPLADLHTRVQELAAHNESLQGEVQVLQLERAQLTQQVSELDRQLEQASSSVAAAAAVVAAGANSNIALSARTRNAAVDHAQDTEEDSSAAAAAAAAAQQRLAQLEAEKQALEQQLQELRYEVRQARNSERGNEQALRAEADSLRQAMAEAQRLFDNQLMQMAAEIQALEAENRRIEAANERSEAAGVLAASSTAAVATRGVGTGSGAADATALAAQVAELQREKQELEAKLVEFNEAEEIIKDWAEYADALTLERDKLQATVTSLTGERDALQAAVQTAQKQAAELQLRLAAAGHEHVGVQQQQQAAQQGDGEVRQRLVSVQQTHVQLQGEHLELLAAHEHLQGEHQLLQEENGRLQARCQQLQADQNGLDANRGLAGSATQAQLAEAVRQLQELQTGNAMLRQEAAAIKAEKQELQQSVQHLQSQVAEVHELRAQLQQLLPAAMAQVDREQAGAGAAGAAGDNSEASRRGWNDQLELLQGENQALRLQLQGLQAALASARAAAGTAGLLQDRHAASSDAGAFAMESQQEQQGLVQPQLVKAVAGNSWQVPAGAAAAGLGRSSRSLASHANASSYSGSSGLLSAEASETLEAGPRGLVGLGAAELALQLSMLQERHAALQAEMVALRATMARAPLLSDVVERSDSLTGAAPVHASSSSSTAEHATPANQQLLEKVSMLTAWRGQAEQTLAGLQAAHSTLKLDHTEALENASHLQKQLSSRDTALQQLKEQVSRLTVELQQARAGEATIHTALDHASTIPASVSKSPVGHTTLTATSHQDAGDQAWLPPAVLSTGSSSTSQRHIGALVQRLGDGIIYKDEITAGQQADEGLWDEALSLPVPPASARSPGRAPSLPLDTEVGRLSAQLRTAAAVVHMTRCALSSCLKVVSSKETADVSEDVDLDVALMCMKDESYGLFQELKRQARDAPRYEAQVHALSQAIVEMEGQLQELQQENQLLAGFQPAYTANNSAASGLAGGSRAGNGGGGGRFNGLSTGVSTPDAGPVAMRAQLGSEDHSMALSLGRQSFGTGTAVTTNPLYADDAGLAISALEQQLALAESQKAEARENVEVVGRDNVRLRREVERLEGELAAGGTSTYQAAVSSSSTRTRSTRKLSRMSTEGEEEEDDVPTAHGVMASRRAGHSASRPLPPEVTRELETLRERCAKLEGICDDLEARAAEERRGLEAQLAAAMEDCRAAQAEAVAAAAAAAAATAKTQSRNKAEDELSAGAGGADKALRDQVAELELQASRLSRENVALAEQLDEERATREALEKQVKRGLKNMSEDEILETVEAFESKYLRLKEKYRKLEAASADELDEMHAQLIEAQHEADDLRDAAARGARNGGGAGGKEAGAAKELIELRRENAAFVAQLVAKQMEAAELAEQQAMLRRDLYRAKEVNMKLAAKMTKLEAQAYTVKSDSKGGGLFGKKRRQTDDDDEEE